MPTPLQRPGGRSARITAAVYAATIAALIEHGLDGLTIEGIAARAGVNKTTIYRRWGTREDLLAAALIANSGRQVEIPDHGRLRDDLVAFALRVRDALAAPASQALLVALNGAGRHAQLAALGRRFWAARLAAARPMVERAVARGEASTAVDADALVLRVVGPLWLAVVGPGWPLPDSFVEQTVDVVLAGTPAVRRG